MTFRIPVQAPPQPLIKKKLKKKNHKKFITRGIFYQFPLPLLSLLYTFVCHLLLNQKLWCILNALFRSYIVVRFPFFIRVNFQSGMSLVAWMSFTKWKKYMLLLFYLHEKHIYFQVFGFCFSKKNNLNKCSIVFKQKVCSRLDWPGENTYRI